jgi:hypothetical protein
MKHLGICAFVLGGALAAGCGGNGGGVSDATLTVYNDSDFAIEELYLTHSTSLGWGANLLSNDLLLPSEHLVLGVDCGTYDVLLVDEQGVDCEVDNVDLCLDDARWHITNNTCDVFKREAERRAAETAAAGSAK